MSESRDTVLPPRRDVPLTPGRKLRDAQKVLHNPLPVIASDSQLRKPEWLRIRLQGGGKVGEVRRILRHHNLVTVCEEAACPNLAECFGGGTATFMIMGDICTRKCPFCDVAHGKPQPLDVNEPQQLAAAIFALGLRYAVITSVDRDDLRDGGAAHFARCITAVRAMCPDTTIEVLVPDFRGRVDAALNELTHTPDVFNHNLETVPRLYREVRPGASYTGSLDLLHRFSELYPHVPTKSGLMLGLGESIQEVIHVLRDLRASGVTMLTLGQYLQPSPQHLAVKRFVTPQEFDALAQEAKGLGFTRVASGPLVRSSYHADRQTSGGSVT